VHGDVRARAVHLLNGLYDAKCDHQPVVPIVARPSSAHWGHFQQEVKLLQMYSDVASAYCEQANEPGTIRHILDRAIRIAQAEKTVTCVIIPADVQEMDAVPKQPHLTHTRHSGVGYWPGPARLIDFPAPPPPSSIGNGASCALEVSPPGAGDTLNLLMSREVAHQKMFEAALDSLGSPRVMSPRRMSQRSSR